MCLDSIKQRISKRSCSLFVKSLDSNVLMEIFYHKLLEVINCLFPPPAGGRQFISIPKDRGTLAAYEVENSKTSTPLPSLLLLCPIKCTMVVRSLLSVRSSRSSVGGRTRVSVRPLPCFLTAATTRCHSPSVSRTRESSTDETGMATRCSGSVKSASAFCCAFDTERTSVRRAASNLPSASRRYSQGIV